MTLPWSRFPTRSAISVAVAEANLSREQSESICSTADPAIFQEVKSPCFILSLASPRDATTSAKIIRRYDLPENLAVSF